MQNDDPSSPQLMFPNGDRLAMPCGSRRARSCSSALWKSGLLLLALLLAFAGGNGARVPADDSPAKKADLVGSRVDVALRSGKTLKGVTVEEAKPGKIPGTIAKLRVFNPATESRILLGAAAVQEVRTIEGKRCLVFDEISKSLAPPDADALEAIHQAVAAEPPAGKTSPAGVPAKKRAAKSRKKDDPAAEAARRAENEAEREAFFKKTGVRLWPELSDDEQKAALVKRKEFLKKVAEHFPGRNMQLHETKYFLMLSSLPQQVAAMCQPHLDAMHEELCKAYAVEQPDKLWLGKTVVVAFNSTDDFMDFEHVFFHMNPPSGVQGAANQVSTGEDVIGCYCGDDAMYFAHVLVHETTHGFNHRYKSSQHLPNWLDEGIAEWVAISVVKRGKPDVARVVASVQQARQRGNLGGDFFTAEHISAWQYGIASSMVNFLLKSDHKAFRKLIDEIKLGQKWEDALKKTYRCTPQELTFQYGRSMGIPNLVP